MNRLTAKPALRQLQRGAPGWAVGLMTGTVLDGNIDVALLNTDGESIETFGCFALTPYQPETVDLLHDCVEKARAWQFDGPEPELFAHVEKRLTLEQSEAVALLVKDAGMALSAITVVGFHGQTVLHHPPQSQHSTGAFGQTRQLGDGVLMSRRLGIPVVNDFRSADMAAGGQGAPLCPAYHQALLSGFSSEGETAVLNLGGVANLTWWDGKQQLIAFDTGPANAPINDFVRHMGAGLMDQDGAFAAAGVVDEERLQHLLNHPYLGADFPKSLDRFDFSWRMAEGLSLHDGAALLTAFCAAAVSRALNKLPKRPTQLLVCGGGRHNPSLMKALMLRTNTRIVPAEASGWRGDATEAECFAFLAARTMRQLPISFPQTTGVSQPLCGGRINFPDE